MMNFYVMVIAGPTGVGKTTLSKILCKHYKCSYISEDEIAKEIFPNEYISIENTPDKLKIVKNQLLKKTKDVFTNNKSVVIDLVNIEKAFFEEIRKRFHNHLILKVLFPPIATTIERDKRKEGWTSGEITIRRFYKKYEVLKSIIGKENYFDNSNQTPKETFKKLFYIK